MSILGAIRDKIYDVYNILLLTIEVVNFDISVDHQYFQSEIDALIYKNKTLFTKVRYRYCISF